MLFRIRSAVQDQGKGTTGLKPFKSYYKYKLNNLDDKIANFLTFSKYLSISVLAASRWRELHLPIWVTKNTTKNHIINFKTRESTFIGSEAITDRQVDKMMIEYMRIPYSKKQI